MLDRDKGVHVVSGRWRVGFFLALVAALLWGVLPIAMKGLLGRLDAYTITSARFLIAGGVLAAFVVGRKRMPSVSDLRGSVLWLLVITIVMLGGNYVLYVIGLEYLSPSTATVVIQLAPIFMLLGSIVIFKESFCLRQWAGFVVLIFGMGLFFNDRLGELLSSLGDYTVGVLLLVASAVFWAVYSMAQKQLLKTLRPEVTLLIIFFACGLLLLPFASVSDVMGLNGSKLLLLLFCAFNTIIAYESLVEALNHWEASRISMVLATTPIITIMSMKFCAFVFPDFVAAEELSVASIVGAMLVVVGSGFCAFSRVGNGKSVQALK